MAVSPLPPCSKHQSQVTTTKNDAIVAPLTEERLAILGHEIRNPLSALTYALDEFESIVDDPELKTKLLRTMRRQVQQLTRLSDDLLDTGRISQGCLTICPLKVDVGRVIQTACEELRPLIEQCGHNMTVTLCNPSITLLGDESRLTQVFANLLHNAAKFTERMGHLQISLEQDEDVAVIQFRDNGRGISADNLKNIFKADTAVTHPSNIPSNGLGIGLRLAKAIVELHGGTIQAISDGLGHGSVFVVRLPVNLDETDFSTKEPIPSTADESKCTLPLPKFSILVVDDDKSIRFLMSRLLEKLHQSVTVADDGYSALHLINKTRPDIVFVDLRMNGLSGFEVARQIRGNGQLKSIKLIALSGNDDHASRAMAAKAGFDRYLTKPTSIGEITSLLREICPSLASRQST